MPAALSVDLRIRAVRAYLAGEGSRAEIAARFGIGTASLGRWVRQYRIEQSVSPKPRTGGRGPKVLEEHHDVLMELLEREPDMTTTELAEDLFEQTGLNVDRTTVGRALRKLGYTRKKRR